MKFKTYFTLFLLIPLLAFTVHKYYMSLCQIEHNENQNALQITLNMFIDDIEFTLNKNHNTLLNLATKNEVENIDDYYIEYLNNHFKITVNNQQKTFTYIGKDYDDDIVTFYLEIINIQEIKSIEVSNTSLFKDFEYQNNIIKIKANNKHKSFYLDKKNDKALLKF